MWDPPAEVRHAIVLRARAFDAAGNAVGKTITNSYFITDLMERQPQLPAVSIAIDYGELYDADSGLFSPNGWDSCNSFGTGNFNQRGREWERLANVEFYELDNNGFAQELGIRVHGGKTRQYMQKPLKLYARSEYGNKKIHYPLFEECQYDKFKRLVLRPFSSGLWRAGIQDLLAQRICRPLKFISLASRPVTLYINGEYWGIYYLQEAPDERLIEELYDVDEEEVNIVGSWFQLENGSDTGFTQMREWLKDADLSDSLQYSYFSGIFDIDDFIDYVLFESFAANQDWPTNNIRSYQYGNAPWRWIFFDGDETFIDIERNMPYYLTYEGEDTWPSWIEATLFFRKLIESPVFIGHFYDRLVELTNSTFSYHNTAPYLEQIKELLDDEVPWQSERFNIPRDYDEWRYAMYHIDQFLRKRPEWFYHQMTTFVRKPVETERQYLLYPNPAKGYVCIQGSDVEDRITTCYIYSSSGSLVATYPLYFTDEPTVCQIPVTSLAPGIYLLSIPDIDTSFHFIVY